MTSTVEFELPAADIDATHVPLGEIITGAKVFKAGSGEYPLLSMTMHHGLVRQEDKFRKPVASRDLSQYKVAFRGQLVVGFPIDEGVLSFQMLVDAGIVSPAYGIWDLRNPDAVDRSYLEKYLRSPQARNYYLAKLRGSTARRRTLPREVFLAMPIPLPPVGEQRRIAAILDKADELRTIRRQTLADLGTLTQAVFTEMFGDPTTASDSVPFSDLTTRITYGFTSPMEHVSDGIPILTGKNVLMGAIDMDNVHFGIPDQVSALTDKSKPNLGDILITKDGTIGRCAVVRSVPICINQSVALVQLHRDKVLPEYVQGMLSHPSVQLKLHGMKKGNSMPHLQITQLAKMRVPLPPLELQRGYSAKLLQVDTVRRNCVAHLSALDALFTTLQYRAFKGEL